MKRAFIVAFPRSGTTLLQSLLGAHPDMATFPESHLLSRTTIGPLPLVPVIVRRRKQEPFARALLRECNVKPDAVAESLNHIKWLDETLLPAASDLVSVFVELLDSIALSWKKTAWLEKTPAHLRLVDLIESVVPGVSFIHIARRPSDAIASLYEAQNYWRSTPRDPRTIAKRWNRDLQRSLKYRGADNHHFVSYEAIADAPHTISSNLAQRMGLAEAGEFSRSYQSVAERVILPDERHKSRNLMPIMTTKRDKSAMSQQLQRAIEELADYSLYEMFSAACVSRGISEL